MARRMARATTGEVIVVNCDDESATQAADSPSTPIDLTQVPDDAIRAELKRRESVEKQRLEAIRQTRIAARNAENIRVSERVDVLLDIFQEHRKPYRNDGGCSDEKPQRVDFGDRDIDSRCTRCMLLALKAEPWAWDIDTRFDFRAVQDEL